MRKSTVIGGVAAMVASGRGIKASPMIVGAATTLIVIVAVFLACNANAGLPFVPVYRVSVQIPDASRLADNDEVRIGEHRVGVVESIDAIQDAAVRLNLKLDQDAEPLPEDSVFRVRYRSALELGYLEVIRGEGDPVPEGFTFNGASATP